MTTSTILLLLVAAASTVAFTPPSGADSRQRRSQTASSGSHSYSSSSSGSGSGSGSGYQGISSRSFQGSSDGYQGGGGYQGAGAGYQGGYSGYQGRQYPYYPQVHSAPAPAPQPFDFASLFGYLQQLQAALQRQQQQAFSAYAPGFGSYSDLESNTLGERFGGSAGGGAGGGSYSGSFTGAGAGNFGGMPGFGSGYSSGGGAPFDFSSRFGGGFHNFGAGTGGGGGGGGDGVAGAAAAAGIGPQGGFQMASLFPDTGLESRFGGSVQPPAGNTYGVFTSSSSGSSDINGQKTSFKTATVGVNDNGKVTFKTVHDP